MNVKKAEKTTKGILLDDETIEMIQTEATIQERSFSSQASLILKDWAAKKKKEWEKVEKSSVIH